MHLEKVKELDEYVQNNFNDIKRSANTICKSYSNGNVDDIINDTYLKLRKKIERDGFDGKNYGGYFWMSLRNEYGMYLRKENRNKTVFINDNTLDDYDYTEIVERTLIEMDKDDKSSQNYYYELMEITEDLFIFINQRFTEEEVYLFRNYYLIPKQTYRKLSERTGFSIPDCSIIIKEMKRVIRKDFIPYYKKKYGTK
jgi:RNA polymerase sigma factor (sigma-70 family)